MTNLRRRLRKLEAQLTDSCGLVPHTQGWFDYWERKAVRILNEEDSDRIPLEYTDRSFEV